MTLQDVLCCDKKTIFLLAHLSPLRRHSVLHCYNLLKHRPEDDVEGGTGAIEVEFVWWCLAMHDMSDIMCHAHVMSDVT